MSAVPVDDHPLRPHVRTLRDGRPPCQTWSRAMASPRDQATLAFEPALPLDQPPSEPTLGPPKPTGHRVHVVKPSWTGTVRTGLPDPSSWSASLALAVAEILYGHRPVGQLSRWVDEQVLATLTVAVRRRRPLPQGSKELSIRPATLRSVHLQFPSPQVVEVSAHVQVTGRSSAFAFRLETWYDRWLCTALELGPAHGG